MRIEYAEHIRVGPFCFVLLYALTVAGKMSSTSTHAVG